MADVILENLVVAPYVVGGLAGDHTGDFLPAVRRSIVEHGQRVLELLVLLVSPVRVWAEKTRARKARRGWAEYLHSRPHDLLLVLLQFSPRQDRP